MLSSFLKDFRVPERAGARFVSYAMGVPSLLKRGSFSR